MNEQLKSMNSKLEGTKTLCKSLEEKIPIFYKTSRNTTTTNTNDCKATMNVS